MVSMHFHVWNHMIPCVELHGRSVGHGSMHGIVWNYTDHMFPCMELHGSLMNLDPGNKEKCQTPQSKKLLDNTDNRDVLTIPTINNAYPLLIRRYSFSGSYLISTSQKYCDHFIS